MARRRDLKTLKDLVEVRQVQQRGAEMAVARTDAALNALCDEQALTLTRLGEQQDRWSRSISGPVMSLPIASAWSAQILDGEAALRGVNLDIENARRDRADKATAWRMASARTDLATDLETSARRQHQTRRDEARLADLSDQFARKSVRP